MELSGSIRECTNRNNGQFRISGYMSQDGPFGAAAEANVCGGYDVIIRETVMIPTSK